MLMTRCKEIYEERGGTLTDKQICAGGEPGKVGDADNFLLNAFKMLKFRKHAKEKNKRM